MINVNIDGCTVDILPVVRGLVSEYDRVKDSVNEHYDTFAVSLGKEDIVAVGMRKELEDDLYIEDIDVVYLHYLGKFGEIATPSPAFSALVDACNELSRPVQPLDMDEESFSSVYCDIINTFELLGESRLAKKAMKKKFDMSSAENFVISWDTFVNNSKGFRELTRLREKYMANRLRLLAKSSERMLVVVEAERIKGIMTIINGNV